MSVLMILLIFFAHEKPEKDEQHVIHSRSMYGVEYQRQGVVDEVSPGPDSHPKTKLKRILS